MAETATAKVASSPPPRRGLLDLIRPSRAGYPEGCRDQPEVIRMPADSPDDAGPPVRIFVGSDSADWRAERALVWSVLQQRNPKRSYDLYLLKELKGVDREGWPSPYAGYRFAVPGFAGGQGRALYLEVGRAFVADPAGLFDLDLGDAALLDDPADPTAPVIMDCARLAARWPIERLQRPGALAELRRVELPGADAAPPSTRLSDGLGDWRPLEPAADRAGFTIFTKDRPSRRFQDLLALHQRMHEEGRPEEQRGPERTFNGKSLAEHIRPVARLAKEHDAGTILDFGAGKGALYQDHPEGGRLRTMADWPGVTITCFDPGYPAFAEPPSGLYDGVISTDVVEHIAADDIPWILDDIFAHAGRFVYVVAACFPAKKTLPNGENAHVTIQPPAWWKSQMESAAARHPGVQWTLCAQTKLRIGPLKRERHLLFRGSA
ncbi:MAG: hypothetical protein R3F54_09910 [Alphaproteobacteria bacterium]